jgi:putative ABC transport system substrate-binding protein
VELAHRLALGVNIQAVEWKFRAFGYPQSQNRNCLRSCGRYFTSCGAAQNPTNPYCAIAVQHARRGAAALGLSLDVAGVSTVSELDASFRAIGQKSPDAALVIADPFLAHERALFAKLECAVPGGLMAYMTSYYDIFRREATFIDKIFKGAKPGDLPVEQPTQFEFVINLKTAKALGLDVPPSLCARESADRMKSAACRIGF